MTWPLTPWYPATTKPVRPGVYLVRTEMEWPRETINPHCGHVLTGATPSTSDFFSEWLK